MTEHRLIAVRSSGSIQIIWIGRGDTHNWPSQSPGLNPLDYYVWGYMKAMVYAHKVNTREELLQ